MPIPSSINDFNANPAVNFPQDTDIAGATVAGLPRAIQSIIKKQYTKGTALSVAADGILAVPVDEGYYDVIGTGFNVTGLSNTFSGRTVKLRFTNNGLVLTHSSSFSLPEAKTITTLAGDIAEFIADTTTSWVCVSYTKTTSVTSFTLDYPTINLSGTNLNINSTNLNINSTNVSLGSNKVDAFPSGTKLPFYQLAAPPGWTISNPGTNYTLISTGAAAGGGTVGGGGGRGDNLVTGTTVLPDHVHTQQGTFTSGTSNQSLNHIHPQGNFAVSGTSGASSGTGGQSVVRNADLVGSNTFPADLTSHNHNVTINGFTSGNSSGNSGTWQPLYAKVIICSKD